MEKTATDYDDVRLTPPNGDVHPSAEGPAREEDADVLRERWLRVAAELDNLRKRTSRQIDAARREERETLLLGFLEVVDNFERALAAAGTEERGGPLADGVRSIHQQMLGLLNRFGAVPIDPLGQPFDPNYHEAVTCVDLPDQPDGTVAEVVQTGYRLDNEHVLRPARVYVVQHSGSKQ
jgi:molecular chaperone GrpE